MTNRLETFASNRAHVPALRPSLWSSSIETGERQPAQCQLPQGLLGFSPDAKACKPTPAAMEMRSASMQSMLNLRSRIRIVLEHQVGVRRAKESASLSGMRQPPSQASETQPARPALYPVQHLTNPGLRFETRET
jgi:hypothetical protein